jgi:hypothetical protein
MRFVFQSTVDVRCEILNLFFGILKTLKYWFLGQKLKILRVLSR